MWYILNIPFSVIHRLIKLDERDMKRNCNLGSDMHILTHSHVILMCEWVKYIIVDSRHIKPIMSCHQQTFIHRRRLGPSRSPSYTTTLFYHCPTLTDCQVWFKPRIVNGMANLNLMQIMIFYCLPFARVFEFCSTCNLTCPTGSIDWQASGCLLNT